MFSPVKQQETALSGATSKAPTSRESAQVSLADQQAREKLATKLQHDIPKSVWTDLERYTSDQVSDQRVVEIKKIILKAIGLDPANIKDCSLSSTADGSAIFPGMTIRMLLGARDDKKLVSFPVTINCGEGIIKVNGKNVPFAQVGSEVRKTREAILQGTLPPVSLADLFLTLKSKQEYPLVGTIKDKNQVIAISTSMIANGDIMKSFQCWIGSGSASTQTAMVSVQLNPATRGKNGDLLLEGKTADNQQVSIIVNSKTGKITFNNEEVVPSAKIANPVLIQDIIKTANAARVYREALADLKARGVKINFKKGVDASEEDDKFKIRDGLKDGFIRTAGGNPLEVLRMDLTDLNAFVAPGINHTMTRDGNGKRLKEEPSKNVLDAGAFSLRSYSINATTAVAEVADFIQGSSRLFTFNPGDPKSKKAADLEIQKYLTTTVGGTNYQKLINDIPAKRIGEFKFDVEKNNDPKLRATFADLLKTNPNAYIGISYIPQGFADDYLDVGARDDLMKGFAERRVGITSDSMQALGVGGFQINGSIIGFRADFPFDPKKHTFTFDKEGLVKTMDGKSSSEEYTDKFGNKIYKAVTVSKDQKDKVISAEYDFQVGIPDARQTGDKVVPQEISIELKGKGIVQGIAQLPYANKGTIEGVTVFSKKSDYSLENEADRSSASQFIAGMHNAELYFGFQKGSKLQELIIRNSQEFNAYSSELLPRAAIGDFGLLDFESKIGTAIDYIGFHEGVHSLDHQSGNKLSGGHFKEMYNKILKDPKRGIFLTDINETSFLDGVTMGGHAQDNELEFLASFLNSMQNKNWKDAVASRTPMFRKTYGETLEALAQNLDELAKSGFLPASAPIIEITKKRIAEIKSL